MDINNNARKEITCVVYLSYIIYVYDILLIHIMYVRRPIINEWLTDCESKYESACTVCVIYLVIFFSQLNHTLTHSYTYTDTHIDCRLLTNITLIHSMSNRVFLPYRHTHTVSVYVSLILFVTFFVLFLFLCCCFVLLLFATAIALIVFIYPKTLVSFLLSDHSFVCLRSRLFLAIFTICTHT